MRAVWLSLAAFAVAILSGCATTTVFAPDPKQKAEIRYDRGIATLWSFGRSSAAIAGAPSRPLELDSDDRPYFVLTVANFGARPINIDIDQISVTANGVPLPIYSYAALMAESKSREERDSILASLTAALQSAAAEQQAYGSSRAHATTSGRVGGLDYSSNTTAQSTTYDPVAAELARQRIATDQERALTRIGAAAARERRALDSSYFRAQTLEKGKPYTGWISVARPGRPDPVNRYEVTVRIGDEEHAFVFEERAMK